MVACRVSSPASAFYINVECVVVVRVGLQLAVEPVPADSNLTIQASSSVYLGTSWYKGVAFLRERIYMSASIWSEITRYIPMCTLEQDGERDSASLGRKFTREYKRRQN